MRQFAYGPWADDRPRGIVENIDYYRRLRSQVFVGLYRSELVYAIDQKRAGGRIGLVQFLFPKKGFEGSIWVQQRPS